VLFSRQLEHGVLEVIECCRARFEIEFPLRDATQFAGLMDCQSQIILAMGFHLGGWFSGADFVSSAAVAGF
jgi:hypothetical protein